MKEILFERNYDNHYVDDDDYMFLGGFSHQSPLFSNYSNTVRCGFSRLASQSAILAEALRGKLTMILENEAIIFLVETDLADIGEGILKMMNNLVHCAIVEIVAVDDHIAIRATYNFPEYV